MEEAKRSNQGYEIIESCTIGSTELVIGHNPKAPNPYVCWYCKGEDNYFWGHYCNELSAAREKLNERYQSESRMFDSDIPKNAVSVIAVSTSYELLSEQDLEEIYQI